jgi:glycosyltransferase involved in cell wall biosynthesis
MTDPFFSIVVTVYNRPFEIVRCVESCLSQSFTDFEIVVVDDGSIDDTARVLDQLNDPRLRIIHHTSNRGTGAARNTGDNAARADWIIRLDSDHALLPDALDTLHKICIDLPEDIAVIGARYRWETGLITPCDLPESDLDYIGRIRWAEEEGGHDNLSCTRRTVFERVHWVECMDPNSLFQLDQARLFRNRIIPDVLALEYMPPVSILRSPTRRRWDARRRDALNQANYFRTMMEKHGAALRRHGPRQYRRGCLRAAFSYFLVGRRREGVGFILKYLCLAPFSLSGWSLFVAGLLGQRAMKIGYTIRDYVGVGVKDYEI